MNWEVCRATWRHLEIQHASRCPIHPVCINEPSLCNSTQQLQGRRTERGHFILNTQYAVSYIYLIIYAFCIKPKAQAPSPQTNTLKTTQCHSHYLQVTFTKKNYFTPCTCIYIFKSIFRWLDIDSRTHAFNFEFLKLIMFFCHHKQ